VFRVLAPAADAAVVLLLLFSLQGDCERWPAGKR
jgi:hypothetical protein